MSARSFTPNPYSRGQFSDVSTSLNRVRYMPNKHSIVTAKQASALRTAEQNRVLKDPTLASNYSVWHYGGGLVHHDARVHIGAFIGLCAIVDEDSSVSKYCTIEGEAEITGGRVSGEARISGNAIVDAGAIIRGSAQISGRAFIGAGANIAGHVKVGGEMEIGEQSTFGGSFHLLGAFSLHNATIMFGDCVITEKKQIAKMRGIYDDQLR